MPTVNSRWQCRAICAADFCRGDLSNKSYQRRRMMSVMRVVHCSSCSRTLTSAATLIISPPIPVLHVKWSPFALAESQNCFCWGYANMSGQCWSPLTVQRHHILINSADTTSDAFCSQQVSLQIHHSLLSHAVRPGACPHRWCIPTARIIVTILHQWHVLENKRFESTDNFIELGLLEVQQI